MKAFGIALLWCAGSLVQAAGYRIDTVTDQLKSPATLAFLPDGRLLVGERPGRLRVIDAQGVLQAQAVTGLPGGGLDATSSLIDVVPDPDFVQTRRLFISHMQGTTKANFLRISTARLEGDRLVDRRTLFDAKPAKSGRSNFGGRLLFLPDRTLLFSVGDGFDARDQAQNPRSHLGKLLRLNRDGSVPADNPFVQRGDAAPEVYSLGHRNVQGLAYDAATRRVYANDHGAKGGDEINPIRPGLNHGWPLATFGVDYIGARVTPYTNLPGIEAPLHHWTPSIAPSALAVSRSERFPEWRGDLFNAALAGRAVYRVRLDGDRVVQQEKLFGELDARIRDVKFGPDGLLYLLTDGPEAKLLRVSPAS